MTITKSKKSSASRSLDVLGLKKAVRNIRSALKAVEAAAAGNQRASRKRPSRGNKEYLVTKMYHDRVIYAANNTLKNWTVSDEKAFRFHPEDINDRLLKRKNVKVEEVEQAA